MRVGIRMRDTCAAAAICRWLFGWASRVWRLLGRWLGFFGSPSSRRSADILPEGPLMPSAVCGTLATCACCCCSGCFGCAADTLCLRFWDVECNGASSCWLAVVATCTSVVFAACKHACVPCQCSGARRSRTTAITSAACVKRALDGSESAWVVTESKRRLHDNC